MPPSRNTKPHMDKRGQPKDLASLQMLEGAHGRYSASESSEASKKKAATPGPATKAIRRRGASKNPNKPIGT